MLPQAVADELEEPLAATGLPQSRGIAAPACDYNPKELWDFFQTGEGASDGVAVLA